MEFDLKKTNINIYPYYNNSYLNDNSKNKTYSINYFIEGITDDELFKNYKNVSLLTGFPNDFVTYENNIINYFTSNVNPYITYFLKYGNYYKEFKYDSSKDSFNTMVRGEITGNINVRECGISNNDDYSIYCYRSDDKQFIGEYKINNGSYSIPNLDVNNHYDIILVDHTRKIEQNVLSYRKPTEKQIPNINASIPTDFEIIYRNTSFSILYNIKKSVYYDFDYVRLIYLGIDGLSYNIIQDKIINNQIFQRELQYGQYKLESVYKDNVSSSNIFLLSDAQSIDIIIPNTTYNPPLGDNINIIGN